MYVILYDLFIFTLRCGENIRINEAYGFLNTLFNVTIILCTMICILLVLYSIRFLIASDDWSTAFARAWILRWRTGNTQWQRPRPRQPTLCHKHLPKLCWNANLSIVYKRGFFIFFKCNLLIKTMEHYIWIKWYLLPNKRSCDHVDILVSIIGLHSRIIIIHNSENDLDV